MDISLVSDLPALEALHAIKVAAHDHDYLALPADPFTELIPFLGGEETAGERVELFLGVRDGAPVGALGLTLWTLDNLSSAGLDLWVDPAFRQSGVATELLAFGIEQVQARGRSRVFLTAPTLPDEPEPQAQQLLDRVGAKPVLEECRRLLDLSHRPTDGPTDPPVGYRVVQWVDRCPDELVDGVAYLMGRMSTDVPLGDMDYEPEAWTVERYREREAPAGARERRRIATAVVDTKSGDVVGLTDIGVARSRPDTAYQWDTIVEPRHRGRRLGMVLKTWNLQQLQEIVPEARFVNTWNAASNSWMIAVNVELGYEVMDTWTEFQLDL